MKQSSFSDIAYENKKKITRKEKFLGEMTSVLPWKQLLKPILRKYPKPGNGRHPIPAQVMLRIYFMQQWYSLSGPAMGDSLYDTESMRRFAGVDINHIPDETTILNFRHFLERHHLPERLFEISAEYLSRHGLLLSEGTIVDATIIRAPSSTKNRDKQRDPEMRQTKKGSVWHFGMKAHIGTDTQGRVHSVTATDASVHDSQIMEDCLHGEEQAIYGDKAYANQARKQSAEAKGINWRVNRKARRGRKLNCADRSFNKKSNRTRSHVEHAFGIVKHLWGYNKVRYRGLNKNAAQIFTLFALANFYKVRHQLPVTTR
jgi:IS5 family transposase